MIDEFRTVAPATIRMRVARPAKKPVPRSIAALFLAAAGLLAGLEVGSEIGRLHGAPTGVVRSTEPEMRSVAPAGPTQFASAAVARDED